MSDLALLIMGLAGLFYGVYAREFWYVFGGGILTFIMIFTFLMKLRLTKE